MYHALHHRVAKGEKPLSINQEERYGGNPTSHTPAHNVPAVAAAFRL